LNIAGRLDAGTLAASGVFSPTHYKGDAPTAFFRNPGESTAEAAKAISPYMGPECLRSTVSCCGLATFMPGSRASRAENSGD
jgi:hypothetical protein